MKGPDKKKLYPNENLKSVCYLSNLPKRVNMEIGDLLGLTILLNREKTRAICKEDGMGEAG